MTINTNCPLCNNNNFKIKYKKYFPNSKNQPFEASITTDIYGVFGQVVKCKSCGFVYQNPRINDENMLSLYNNLKDTDYLLEQDCRSMNAHLSLRIIKKYKNSGNLLDVGCSTGIFLNSARMNFNVHGIEPSIWASEIARNNAKMDVINGDFCSEEYPEENFDVISFVDVIEHIAEPKKALIKARKILKPGGLVYIVTPDVGSIMSKLLGSFWWGLRPAHLHYFSKKTLLAMLKDAGFEILECNSFGRIFSYKYWLSRFKKYPRLLYNMLKFMIHCFGIKDKVVYLNTRDSLEVCAIKNDQEKK